LDGIEFEIEIAKLFRQLGYKARASIASDYEGIDIEINADNDIAYVQCKHYTSKKVSPNEIREFQGATMFSGKSILIGSSGFTARAVDQARKSKMLLLDLEDVINLNSRDSDTMSKIDKYLKKSL